MRLAVLGSPIAHSRSPRIHAAAYAVLGLDWSYEAIEQHPDSLAGFLDGLDATWRGVSVTAPLKEAAAAWASTADDVVGLTGASNTLRIDCRRSWNTDVLGARAAITDAGVDHVDHGTILGGGATAVSALVALAELGTRGVHVRMRDVQKGDRLVEIGARLGVDVTLASFEAAIDEPEVVVSTLPAAATIDLTWTRVPAVLLDADYARGSSRFADLGSRVVPGIEMLLHQALAQVRIFVHGDPLETLDDEARVWQAMRQAV